jgi:hypothetical protein
MWKKLLDHLKGIAPMVVGAAGTAAGGPLVGGVSTMPPVRFSAIPT